MISTRCAACKYLRQRCDSNCIFFSLFYFKRPTEVCLRPQDFWCQQCWQNAQGLAVIHNLIQVPVHHRAEAANSLYLEAQFRIQDPIYGCAGIISLLQQQIYNAQNHLARIRAENTFSAHQAYLQLQGGPQFQQIEASSSFNNVLLEHEHEHVHVDQSLLGPCIQSPWFL
ncbi:hypothetical protein HHK36_027813 [Tetracentron sinense]|uniref:LOB domain-containing protein n=1 Tax=Tetracentron sinense TaxID=13715 RepID=A0A834YFH6_TETSI|nr:hypothetical protein HHK36_027813 [Tetracentron sinense]